MKTKKIILTAMFASIGIVLPQLIHLFGGPSLGSILLPMHLPVFIGAMLLGVQSGIIIAVISVGIGALLGMPPIPIASYMIFELITYAILSGFLYKNKKFNIYVSFIIAKISGMLIALIVTTILLKLFNIGNPLVFGSLAMFAPGIPGIIIQLALVPPVVILIERGVRTNEQSS